MHIPADMPIDYGQVIGHGNVSEKHTCLLRPDAVHVRDHPLPYRSRLRIVTQQLAQRTKFLMNYTEGGRELIGSTLREAISAQYAANGHRRQQETQELRS